jgi:hypothetical protein
MIRGALSMVLVLVVCSIVASARPAAALFHIAHIVEVNARAENDATDQYVEIEMDFGGQTITSNSVLAAWDCDGTFLGDLLVVPGDVPNGGDGVRWIMATKNPVGSITPDFVIPDSSPDIPPDCGQVCWGAPGVIPPNPPNWSRDNLSNFVDCVAYGPYTGPTRTGSGGPTPLTPGDGTYALVRLDDRTFAPACPTPENSAGAVGDYGPCTDPTTTTTTIVTTTSTTLPGSEDLLAGGLLLRAKEGKPAKSKLKLRSIEALPEELTLGRGPGSPDDPTLHGGRLLVFSSVAGAFVNVYPLDVTTGTWAPKRKRGEQVGYTFKGGGAMTNVTITDSRWLTVKGRGADLDLQLAVDPRPVGVILEIGGHRYCFEFGARGNLVFFKASKRFRAPKNATALACPTVPD